LEQRINNNRPFAKKSGLCPSAAQLNRSATQLDVASGIIKAQPAPPWYIRRL
jgi:hypothetical protein